MFVVYMIVVVVTNSNKKQGKGENGGVVMGGVDEAVFVSLERES